MVCPPVQKNTVATTTPVRTGIPAMRLMSMAATKNQASARNTTEPTAHSRARPGDQDDDGGEHLAPLPEPCSFLRLLVAGELELVEVGDEL